MTWKAFLSEHTANQEHPAPGRSSARWLYSDIFINLWADHNWVPSEEDALAAARLHMQLISRITTQRLGYLDGDEKTALDSVYKLFGFTRDLCDKHPKAWHFKILAWHVLNTHVRPFTAKWHKESERGALVALDTTDEFRSELNSLQKRLWHFSVFLLGLSQGDVTPAKMRQLLNADAMTECEHEGDVSRELEELLEYGIPAHMGGIEDAAQIKWINEVEKTAIDARRKHYALSQPDKVHATGLALSGGGIRSATFSLGVLIALARRGLMPQFDYLSTVSGGGYLGSFLTAFLNTPALQTPSPEIGLRADQVPFDRSHGEGKAIQHLRHYSKYLAAGSFIDRLSMMGAQFYGMLLNSLCVIFIACFAALLEYGLRSCPCFDGWPQIALPWAAIALGVWALVSLVLVRWGTKAQKVADWGLIIAAGFLLAVLAWIGVDWLHFRFAEWELSWPGFPKEALLIALGAVPILSAVFSGLAGRIWKTILGLLSVIAAPLFFFGIYLTAYYFAGSFDEVIRATAFSLVTPVSGWPAVAVVAVAWLIFIGLCVGIGISINVNFTSPHRLYRKKLADAYLIQGQCTSPRAVDKVASLKLSKATSPAAPYHLINAALNVPATKKTAMQGRLTDSFLFSRDFCGSPLTGYAKTDEWEAEDKHLDLGTAMAISGAAAAPQMGLGTKKRLSFWLALLNIRLGYWLCNPAKKNTPWYLRTPSFRYLIKEMFGWVDESAPRLYVSDGGHFENLGVYELLRRRCRFIVAVDGEQDERMTFAALTTLQRLAQIDFGVEIDINLDDLRLGDKGLSRSHFRFCRIKYPEGPGYLLYVKLSLTGNEGEFLRRYRLDEPAFPHHSTADQFFSEAQFEAYRSLGEHVGDKLFMKALVGEELAGIGSSTRSEKQGKTDEQGKDEIVLEDWFKELSQRLL